MFGYGADLEQESLVAEWKIVYNSANFENILTILSVFFKTGGISV